MSEKTIFDGVGLVNTLQDKINELETGVSELLAGGIALADAEKEYKILLRQFTLAMREDGVPMAMIDKTILGAREVAEARYKRDVAETIYETRKERINATKLEIRILEGQINREYNGKLGA